MPQPEIYYINQRGKSVSLELTNHARMRFYYRWKRIFPGETLLPEEVDIVLKRWFESSYRIEPNSYELKKRLKKHGKDTLYFKNKPFLFVIQSASIRTVEISDDNCRELNKKEK